MSRVRKLEQATSKRDKLRKQAEEAEKELADLIASEAKTSWIGWLRDDDLRERPQFCDALEKHLVEIKRMPDAKIEHDFTSPLQCSYSGSLVEWRFSDGSFISLEHSNRQRGSWRIANAKTKESKTFPFLISSIGNHFRELYSPETGVAKILGDDLECPLRAVFSAVSDPARIPLYVMFSALIDPGFWKCIRPPPNFEPDPDMQYADREGFVDMIIDPKSGPDWSSSVAIFKRLLAPNETKALDGKI